MKTLKLTETELLTLLRLNAEIRALASEHLIRSSQRRDLLEKIDPQGELRKADETLGSIAKRHTGFVADYQSMVNRISDRLGVRLEDYGFDDTTGELKFVPKDPPPQAVATPEPVAKA